MQFAIGQRERLVPCEISRRRRPDFLEDVDSEVASESVFDYIRIALPGSRRHHAGRSEYG